MPTTLRNTDILFNDASVQETAYGPTNVQQFDSTGTWTKPTGRSMARIQVWGGGGGGGRSNVQGGNTAGAGGAYNEVTVPLSFLAASFTATVGAGGAGATSTAFGGVGGTSSVPLATAVNGRTSVQAFGGGGGGNNYQYASGGGQLGAGVTVANYSAPGGPILNLPSYYDGTTHYQTALGSAGAAGGYGNIWGGAASYSSSLFGGAGGGLSAATTGVSLWGGAGGNNAPGIQPGGGGGVSPNTNINGSSGAAGRIIITCW